MLILDPFLDLIISSTSLNITDNGYAIFAVFPYIQCKFAKSQF